jgi:hypothetical protein
MGIPSSLGLFGRAVPFVKFSVARWFLACACATALGAVSPAAATEVQETFIGTIIGGDGATDGNPAPDRLGLFGTAGASVTGDAYTATYVFNTSLGTLTSSACLPASASCSSGTNTLSGPPGTIPIVSETLTINGKSFSFGGTTFPINSAELVGINNGSSFPSNVFAEVEANSDLNSLRNDLAINDGALPSSLITPFTYTVQSGDGANSTDSFFQADTTGGLDRFEFGITSVTLADVSATPLPASWTMMLLGLAALGFAARRRMKKSSAAFAAA